jgi:ketosteroid isomerase-like protein
MAHSSSTPAAPMQLLEKMFAAETSFMASTSKDLRLLSGIFHPDVVVHEPTSLPYAGDWRGLAGIADLLHRMSDVFSKMAVEDLHCSGDPERLHVSCILSMTLKATGASVRQPFTEVLRFENGLLLEGTPFYFDTAEISRAMTQPPKLRHDVHA